MTESPPTDAPAPNATAPATNHTGLFWRQFGLRDVFWIIIVVALAMAWWRATQQAQLNAVPTTSSTTSGGVQRVEGPLQVRFRQRTGPNSTSSGTLHNVQALDFHPNAIIVTRGDSGSLFLLSELVYFRWSEDLQAKQAAKNQGH